MIGTKAGPYVLIRKLGEGGMGAVFLAEHERLRITKAVKVLLPEFSRNPDVVKRFENEAMAAARLQHRNIIGIDDFGQLPDGQWYIVMPLLEGASLERFLADRSRLTIHQTLHLVAQVCAALQAAHEQGIVHRDLKPANVFISHTPTNPFHVTLLDFGIAKLRGDARSANTLTGMVIGTPAYMAAEMLEDSSRADVRSDIFALGVMTYQLVTGELPFGLHSGPILYNLQMTQRPRPPANVSPEWAAAIMSALALSPNARPASAQAFALALASATPADPPYEPSGAEIVTAFAPELLSADAYDPTVKNTSDAGRIAVLLWPRPDTPPPEPDAVPVHSPVSAPMTAGKRTVALGGPRTPEPPRPAEPGVQAVAATPTTLSAASGPVPSAPVGSHRRFLPLIVALGAVAVALVVAIVIAVSDRNRSVSAAAPRGADASPASVTSYVAVPDASAAAVHAAIAIDASAAPVADAELGTVLVETSPEKATVTIDGVAAGASPQQIKRPVGTQLTVGARLDGYRSAKQSVLVAAGSQRVRIRLDRKSSRPRAGTGSSFDPDDVVGD